jgi:hypothetical protein
VTVSNATVDLCCTDLVISGTLNLGGGRYINARHIIIAPGGQLNTNSGELELTGTFDNGGSFSAGSSKVKFVDVVGCPYAPSILGSSTFFDLSVTGAAPKTLTLPAGQTQNIIHQLSLLGAPGRPLSVLSSSPSMLAYLNLLPGGLQNIQSVGVNNVGASGQTLAPYQSNLISGGLAPNWFEQFAVPSLSLGALLLLIASLILLAYRHQGQRRT